MIIKLQGMNNDTWFYDTDKVQVTKVKYTKEEFETKNWIFELILEKEKLWPDFYAGYLFNLKEDILLYTELDVWIDGELINE